MKKWLLAVALTGLSGLLCGPALAQDQGNQGDEERTAEQDRQAQTQEDTRRASDLSWFLDRYDRNNNGVIEREELPARLRDSFDQLDRNNNDKLSRQELRAHAARMLQQEQMAGDRRERGRGGRERMADAVIIWVVEAERDAPSLRELQQAYQLLRRLDRDNDGQIARQEIMAAHRQLLGRRFRAFLEEQDANNDGKISPQEAQGTALGQNFGRFDRNDDGFLSRQDFRVAPPDERRYGETPRRERPRSRTDRNR